MANLDVETAHGGAEAVWAARADLDRVKSALDAVRAFSDAEPVDPSRFEPLDLADLAEEVAAQAGADRVTVTAAESLVLPVWPDGVRLALDNLVRNALTHGGIGLLQEVVTVAQSW